MTESKRFMTRLVEQAGSPLEQALLKAGTDVRVAEATRTSAFGALGIAPNGSGVVRLRALPFGRTSLLFAAMVISAAAVAIPLSQRANSGQSKVTPAVLVAAVESAANPAKPVDAVAPAGVEQEGPKIDPAAVQTDVQSARPNRQSDISATQRVSVNAAVHNLLAAELAALDAARAKLSAGDAKSALMLLDAYQREFSRPRLALEAEVLRIDALDRAGQTEAARRRAVAFIRSHPKGVLTGRVRRYLEN